MPVETTKKRRTPKESAYTLSVPEAGRRYYGISRNASYRAAERGDIITVDVGGLKRVPIAQMEKMLGATEARTVALEQNRGRSVILSVPNDLWMQLKSEADKNGRKIETEIIRQLRAKNELERALRKIVPSTG